MRRVSGFRVYSIPTSNFQLPTSDFRLATCHLPLRHLPLATSPAAAQKKKPADILMPAGFAKSGRRGSNPRQSPWEGDTLPLSYSRIAESKPRQKRVPIHPEYRRPAEPTQVIANQPQNRRQARPGITNPFPLHQQPFRLAASLGRRIVTHNLHRFSQSSESLQQQSPQGWHHSQPLSRPP
jgi:hypothetical protein